jgi:hypothetical protein
MSTWKILGTFQGQIFVLGTKIPEKLGTNPLFGNLIAEPSQ